MSNTLFIHLWLGRLLILVRCSVETFLAPVYIVERGGVLLIGQLKFQSIRHPVQTPGNSQKWYFSFLNPPLWPFVTAVNEIPIRIEQSPRINLLR